MDTRKRLYKTKQNFLTLTERMKKDNSRRGAIRKNAFDTNRKIELDDSISTPHKAAPVLISKIKDKPERLRKFIEQKREAKFKNALEAREPFVPYVPIGRWLEKKSEPVINKPIVITTPVRKALLNNDKILKKTTMKELASTAKKMITSTANKVTQKSDPKSRKQILAEIQVQPAVVNKKKDDFMDLNSTFEILSSSEDENEKNLTFEFGVEDEKSEAKQSENLKPEIVEKKPVSLAKKPVAVKKISPKVVKVEKKISPKRTKKVPAEKLPVKQKSVSKVSKPQTKAKIVKIVQRPAIAPRLPSSEEETFSTPPLSQPSQTFKLYKTSLDIQTDHLTLQLKDLQSNSETFINLLPEDTQTQFHQHIQQGNKLINEKKYSFLEVLDRFENAGGAKRVTKEDVSDFWDLLYDEFLKFKEETLLLLEIKKSVLNEAELKKKKRRTTKNHNDATPSRRSRRIAEHTESPSTHTCFGCTPISSSKINTPRSIKKRRTLFKDKAIDFD